jgi:hypothetical protein
MPKAAEIKVVTTRAGTVRFEVRVEVVGLPAGEVSSRLGRAVSQPT